MTCCGNKRAQFQAQSTLDRQNGGQPGRPVMQQTAVRVIFEYAGHTPVRVVGAVTGKHYRFSGPGARLEVDPRDRRSIAALPKFRQVIN